MDKVFELICKQAEKAALLNVSHKFLPVPGGAGRTRLLLQPDGSTDTYYAEPNPQKVEILSVKDFVAYVGERKSNAVGDQAVVFYSEDGLFAWLSEMQRIDQVWCPLKQTPLFSSLRAIEQDGFKGEQRETYNLLRIEYGKALVDQGFYNWVRKCKWRSGAMTDRTVGVGADSFGRDIELAVANEDGSSCPEQFALRVKVYEDPVIADDVVIDMAVDVQLERQRFVIKPFPGVLDRAVDRELGAISAYVTEELRSVDVPVYRGRPRSGEPFVVGLQ